MPDSRSIVVDAKTPLDAYMDAVEAPDDETRRLSLARHAQQVEQRVRELGQKSYWEQFEDRARNSRCCSCPAISSCQRHLRNVPTCWTRRSSSASSITTPSTLMALLKVIAYGWRQKAVTENAKEIRKTGEDHPRSLNVPS